LGDGDDDHTALACFAESGHQIFALWRISGPERLKDDASDGRCKECLDSGDGDTREQA